MSFNSNQLLQQRRFIYQPGNPQRRGHQGREGERYSRERRKRKRGKAKTKLPAAKKFLKHGMNGKNAQTTGAGELKSFFKIRSRNFFAERPQKAKQGNRHGKHVQVQIIKKKPFCYSVVPYSQYAGSDNGKNTRKTKYAKKNPNEISL
jgi:hypothetical protein